MEEYAPWLTCRMGKKLYLLAKDEKAYYAIEVGKDLDYATEEWLEQQGVSENLLKELHLPFEYIPKLALRGIAISGNVAGCYIYLYLKSEKRKLMLELDYDPDWMDEFFAGISRFTPPAEKGSKKKAENDRDSWRREKRDAELYKKLHWVPAVLIALSLVVNFGYFRNQNPFWFTLCLLVLAAPVVLDILMPAYFTIFFTEKNKKRAALSLEAPLLISLVAMMMTNHINLLDDSAFWRIIGITATVSGVVCLMAEEFRREPLWLLAAVFMGGVFLSFAVARANEVYAPKEPQAYILEVEDTHKSGGRRAEYYCYVTLPDGREVTLNISRSLYEDLEPGDYVLVENGVGFFGIEYANAYRAE